CGAGTGRIGQLDKSVASGRVDEPGADLPPPRHQSALRLAFVHHEEHVSVVQRGNSLSCHVIRVTGPDPDDVNAAGHVARLAAPAQSPEPLRPPVVLKVSGTRGIDYRPSAALASVQEKQRRK